MKPLVVLPFVLASLAASSPAAADGMAFPEYSSSTVDIQATAQRAVLWLRGTTWELHLQPEFGGEAGAVAWIVPFPVRPTVSEGNVEFLDQLERLTAPMFVETCWDPCCDCWGGDAGADAGGPDTEVRDALINVIVWEAGTVGVLEYVILSAADGDSLTGWLETNGYRVPSAAAGILATLETEGLFFFAARLPAGDSPEKVVAPVRFQLPGMDPPVYPLRLTALGVPAGAFLDLTLWVVYAPAAAGDGYLLSNHPWGSLPEYAVIRDADDFRAAVDGFFASHPPDDLLLLFSLPVWDTTSRIACDYWSYLGECLAVPSGVVPGAELTEIAAGNAIVQRYQARLATGAFATDLEFRAVTGADLPDADNAYTHDVGMCWECPPHDADVGAGDDGADVVGETGGRDGNEVGGGDIGGADVHEPDALEVTVSGGGAGCECRTAATRSGALCAFGTLALLTGLVLRRHRRGGGR